MQDKLGDYPAAIRGFELYLLAAPAAQDAESVQKRIIERANYSRGSFGAYFRYAHHLGSGDYISGELTLSNGSIQFHESSNDVRNSFAFSVSDVRSVQRKGGPMFLGFLRSLHIELKNGKKLVFLPMDPGDEGALAIEKAIKDMDPEHRIVFK